jgi:hypothetical protein
VKVGVEEALHSHLATSVIATCGQKGTRRNASFFQSLLRKGRERGGRVKGGGGGAKKVGFCKCRYAGAGKQWLIVQCFIRRLISLCHFS